MTLQTRPGQFRHTVILTATGKGLEHVDSLDAMPPPLRAQCLKALDSRSSGTVVIAGQAGAEPERPAGASAAPPEAAVPRGRAPEALLALWVRLAVAVAAAVACLLAWRA
jgi:hypothetical protein